MTLHPWAAFTYFLDRLRDLFLSAGSLFSLTSLITAFCLAALFLIVRRRQRNRRVRPKVILRALFPRRIISSPSSFADIGYFFFNVFVFGVVLGWAILSFRTITNVVIDLLTATFGTVQPTSLPDLVSRSVITLMVFVAYELGYWLDHYISHRVPFFWEFHKVHHTAEVLTPLTVWRVHPVDSLKFYNILAVVMATANGLANYIFGKTVYQYAITDTNIILVLFIHAYIHLQHTHLWVSFTGVLGRVFISPAHHQVHHSTNPEHFNRNLGSCLALWDWCFGTLHVPTKEPEKLTFGVEPGNREDHTIAGAFVTPIRRAVSHITPVIPKAVSASVGGAEQTPNR